MRKVNSFDELKVLADELKPNLSLRKIILRKMY